MRASSALVALITALPVVLVAGCYDGCSLKIGCLPGSGEEDEVEIAFTPEPVLLAVGGTASTIVTIGDYYVTLEYPLIVELLASDDDLSSHGLTATPEVLVFDSSRSPQTVMFTAAASAEPVAFALNCNIVAFEDSYSLDIDVE